MKKFSILPYVFFSTVGVQIAALLIAASVVFMGVVSLSYDNQLALVVCIVGWIVTVFALVTLSQFVSKSTRTLFAFHSDFKRLHRTSPTITKETVYTTGPKNIITGKRPIIAKTREVKRSGNPLLMLVYMFNLLLVAVFGIIAFIIDFVWVLSSTQRVEEWNEVKNKNFYKLLLIFFLVIIVVWGAVLGCVAYDNNKYAPNDLQFNITHYEKSTRGSYMGDVHFYGEMSGSKTDIERVNANFCFMDKDGNILVEDDEIIVEYLRDDENGNKIYAFRITTTITSNDSQEALKLWNSNLDEIDVSIDVQSIEYQDGKHILLLANKIFGKGKTIIN